MRTSPSSPLAAAAPAARSAFAARARAARVAARFTPSGRSVALGVPVLWLARVCAWPFVLLPQISFADQVMGIPPDTALMDV
ncbi:putrescine ABC transporter permease PotH, partial [Burkholderia pseudomallei]